MHKIRLIIITVILIATVGIAPIYADMITEGPIISDDIVSYSTISNALKEELKNAGEDDLIPVAIELKDDIDYEEVDRLAYRIVLDTETCPVDKELKEVVPTNIWASVGVGKRRRCGDFFKSIRRCFVWNVCPGQKVA